MVSWPTTGLIHGPHQHDNNAVLSDTSTNQTTLPASVYLCAGHRLRRRDGLLLFQGPSQSRHVRLPPRRRGLPSPRPCLDARPRKPPLLITTTTPLRHAPNAQHHIITVTAPLMPHPQLRQWLQPPGLPLVQGAPRRFQIAVVRGQVPSQGTLPMWALHVPCGRPCVCLPQQQCHGAGKQVYCHASCS